MKKNIKHLAAVILTFLLIIGSTVAVFAASGSYSTTYNMTGGVYSKRTWSATAKPTFTVSNSNCYSVYDGTIYVMLQRKKLTGYSSVSESTLKARNSGSCTLKGDTKGTYRVYLRQLTGYQMTGNLDISWRW